MKLTTLLQEFLCGAARVGAAAAIAGATVVAIPVFAQEVYPTRNVRVIVPFTAGGGTDIVTRIFAQHLGDRLGKSFFVENKAGGGGGSVGSLELARSKPDGYTIGAGTSSGLLNAAVDPAGYNPLKELDPVARFGATTLVLVVNSKLPIKNVPEFIAYAKAKPGLAYGSSGTGSANHFTGEMLAKGAGVELTHVPYRGESAAIIDVVSGQIASGFMSVGIAKPYIQAGQLRALAVTTERRFPALPDVPTMAEFGYKDIVVDAFYGLYVPKGTPPVVVDLLVKHVNEIRVNPEVSKKLLDQLSFDTTGTDNPKGFRTYMENELARYSRVAVDAGLIGMKSK
ncbi:MAG: tripartite tricarboxylate transporter substrate binding protein [Burkholderiaceae bacterium]|nr:tripartite tricarboxylate transporter substrate binding protein [Burkholderiaceae bacterium]